MMDTPIFNGSGELQGEFTPNSLQVIDYSQKPILIMITGNNPGTNCYSWTQVYSGDPTFATLMDGQLVRVGLSR